jgi:hypothetical protein
MFKFFIVNRTLFMDNFDNSLLQGLFDYVFNLTYNVRHPQTW